MQSQEFTYEKDDANHDLKAVVSWWPDEEKKPIAVILHAGGYVIGAGGMIPILELRYLTRVLGFVTVAPNYRLAPQVPASKGAFPDSFSAYEWCQSTLPELLSKQSVKADPSRIVVMGHSCGGTLSLALAHAQPAPKAICLFYPGLYASDPDSPARKPYNGFANFPPFEPTEENYREIYSPLPKAQQLSAYPLGKPGTPPGARTKWHMSNMTKGKYLDAIEPSGDLAAIDPCTKFKEIGKNHPPVIIVHGEKDDIPGAGPVEVQRCAKELKDCGTKEVEVVTVPGAKHMFDITITKTDENWPYVKKGLQFLGDRV